MDRPDLEIGRHRYALDALALVNTLSQSGKIVYRPIKAWARRQGIKTFRMLDVACGGGDVALDVQRRACRDALHADELPYGSVLRRAGHSEAFTQACLRCGLLLPVSSPLGRGPSRRIAEEHGFRDKTFVGRQRFIT